MKAKKFLAGALASMLTMTAGLIPAGTSVLEMTSMGMTAYAIEEVTENEEPDVSEYPETSIETVVETVTELPVVTSIMVVTEPVESTYPIVTSYVYVTESSTTTAVTATAAAETSAAEDAPYEVYFPDTKEIENNSLFWYHSDDSSFYRDGTIVIYNDDEELEITDQSLVTFEDTPESLFNGRSGLYEVKFTVDYNGQTINGIMPVMISQKGDANLDGITDLHDVILIAKSLYLIAKSLYPSSHIFNKGTLGYFSADCNYDGKVNLYDAIEISNNILKGEININGTTQANGGITIENTEAKQGENSFEIPFYIDEEISSCGCIVKFNVPDEIELLNISSALKSEGDTALFAYATGFKPSEPMGILKVDIPADTQLGEYTITAEILALDDGNDGYYANPTVTPGILTVKESPVSDFVYDNNFDTTEKGIGIERVTVPYGTTEAELGLYMLNVNSKGCIVKIAADAPLTITDFSKYMSYERNGDGNYTVLYLSGDYYRTDTAFGGVKFAIAEDAEPGTYPVSLEIDELDDDGAGVSKPTAISGSITISEPQSEEPSEPTEEPTEAPTEEPTEAPTQEPTETPDLPQTGNNASANFVIAVSALMITAAGAFVMMKSGIIIRKKESK